MLARLRFCFGLGLLLSGFGAAAQTTPLPTAEPLPATVPERAQQQATYLADALQLKARQVATLRTALQARLDAAEMLSHLLFTSEPAATAAADAVDFRYYTTVGKVLTPAQFHKLLLLDEQAAITSEGPLVLHER